MMTVVVVSWYLYISNIKCKLKDDKTKCFVKIDNCSSTLIISLKLPSIRLKTSKNDDVVFTKEEPPNPDNEKKH